VRRSIAVVLAAAACASSGAAVQVVSPPAALRWRSPEEGARWAGGPWRPIATGRLAGLAPGAGAGWEKRERCQGDAVAGEPGCLRRDGGLVCFCAWLEVPGRGPVRSAEALRAAFAPVESEAEAVAFVAAQVPDLAPAGGVDTLAGATRAVEDGFLVQVVRQNTFGCGSHEHTAVVFQVTRAGELVEVAAEPTRPRAPGAPRICVD
jgi:hypothetical protein